MFYEPLLTENGENICTSIYKLGDNTTHSRKVSKNFQFDHKNGSFSLGKLSTSRVNRW